MPKKVLQLISVFGIGIYALALLLISVAFHDYALHAKWILWGLGEVLFFFVLTTVFYPRWKGKDKKHFLLIVFLVALVIRVVYVVAIGYYYYYETGLAYEYNAGDGRAYHAAGLICAKWIKDGHFLNIFTYLNTYYMGFSDQGYILWLSTIYAIFGRSLLVPRILKALMSAYLCIVVYKLGERTFGERTGRLAAVMCVFMPILIQICGIHTKEMEMIFLSILALERMDYLIRSKRYTFWNILCPILLTGLTFGFRTIIGMCLIFAFLVFVVLSPKDLIGKRSKIVTIASVVILFLMFLFTPVGREMKIIYRLNFSEMNYQSKRYEALGFQHSTLAKNIFLIPGAFVVPLTPMVEDTPDHNKMINGSTYIKNFIAFFAMLAIVIAIRQRKWRDFSLIGAYELSYLAIIMLSFAFNSERFHEPAVPLILLMSAYAMTHLRHKDLKIFYIYCGALLITLFVWNWLKLSARGLA